MSKALFINGNVHGHINPTLALTEELIRRGEEVSYFSTDDFKEIIEGTGAKFISYGSVLQEFLRGFKPSGSHPFYTLVEFMAKMDQVVIPIILEKAKYSGFDYIIHDSMFGGGSIVAKLLGIPAVCSCTSFAMSRPPMPPHMFEPGFHPQLDKVYDETRKIGQLFDVEVPGLMDIFFKREKHNLVYTSRYFQPDSDSFDESFRFVGPSIKERKDVSDFPYDKLDSHNVVYISMGTINNNLPEFYQKCFEAFADSDVKVVLSVGKKLDISSFQYIPDNFIVKNYVPQLEILKRTSVFVSHGGLNSVCEAFYYNVPIIAIPVANDQPMVTRQLAGLGAGLGMQLEELTPETLRDNVFKVLSDESYKKASQKIGDSFRNAGGYMTAADYIFEFKKTI